MIISRFLPDFISTAVWLYHRLPPEISGFGESYSAQHRSVIVSYKTILRWCLEYRAQQLFAIFVADPASALIFWPLAIEGD